MNRISLIALLALAVVGTGCVNRKAQEQRKETTALLSEKAKPVSIREVQRRTMIDSAPITGQIATDADASIGPKIGGRLATVYVTEGQAVTAGQVVARVDTTNQMISVEQARAQVQSAQAALSQAMSNARVAPSRTTAAVDAAKAQLRQAQATLKKALAGAQATLKKALAGARPEERAQSEAALRAAESNKETAKRNRDRVSNLYREGAASQQQLDGAENQYQAALAQWEQAVNARSISQHAVRDEDIQVARESVRQAEEGLKTAQANKRLDVLLSDQVRGAQAQLDSARAQLRLATQQLEDANVRAPFAGTIMGKPTQAGTVVAPGVPVARIVGAGGMYFEGDVPASMLERVKVGSSVFTTVDGLEGREYIGRLASISPGASNVGRVFRARIQFPAFDTVIRAGMFARGKVKLGEAPDAIVVPTGAVVERGGKDIVFLVADGKAKAVTVKKGLENDGLIQVTGGVLPGDKVIVLGVNDVEDGTPVQVGDKTKESK